MRHTHYLTHKVDVDGDVQEHTEQEMHVHDIPEGSVGPHMHYQVPPGVTFWIDSNGHDHLEAIDSK